VALRRPLRMYSSIIERRDRLCIHPQFLAPEWIERSKNLVVFDLHADSERNAGQESFPEMLMTSMNDLRNLLKWLPPESTVVFSCGDDIERFDAQIEGTLLQLGIEAVYLLDKNATFK